MLGGEIESFRLLVDRYQGPVGRMIRNITCDRESCEDIAQEVFLTAYEKLSSFDASRSSFPTWLFTIARNKGINALKKKKPLTTNQPPERSFSHNPSAEMAKNEFFEALDAKLKALPGEQSRAFVLAEFEELTYEQIAQIEGVRIGTIKSRINRAKQKLRLALRSIYEKHYE